MGLSYRVRDGTGRFPHAMTAVTLLPVPLWFVHRGVRVGVGSLWLLLLYDVVFMMLSSVAGMCFLPVTCPLVVAGLLVGNRIVDA